jgi:iron complex outermembrane recepter protein
MKYLNMGAHIASMTLMLCCAANAQALERKRVAVDIEPQSVSEALRRLTEQTGLQVLMPGDNASADAFVGQRVAGEFPLPAVLDQLLSNTGLTYEFVNKNTFRVMRVDSRRAAGDPAKEIRVSQAAPGSTSSAAGQRSTQDESAPVVLEQVIVTAQKRVERLIDVPQSVSVLSAETLGSRGATQFRDFADTIPGVSFMSSAAGRTQVTLRGVTTGLDVSPTVGVYVDEVPYGSSTGFARGGNLALDVGLFDLNRIEVLRGPQGTLYGASAMGGILKYVTREPDLTNSTAQLQAGFSGTKKGDANYDVAGSLNAPLVDGKVAVRASGYMTHDGGYVNNLALGENDVNNSDIYGGRVDFLFRPLENFDLRLTAFAQNISQEGFSVVDLNSNTGAPIDGSLDQRHFYEEPFDQHFRLLSATATYEMASADLTSITSFQTTDARFSFDTTRSFSVLCPIFIQTTCGSVAVLDGSATDKWTQELRLASSGKQMLEWQFGAFYTNEDSSASQVSALRDPAGQPISATLFTYSGPSNYEEYAGFGDVTWNATEKLSFTAGARYSENRQDIEQIATGLIGSNPRTKSSEGVATYLANARYRFNENTTAYARFATGYRPGGPNYVVTDSTTGALIGTPTYDADRLKSYEVGFKADHSSGMFSIDASAYFIDWDNIIVTVFRGAFSGRANAPGGATIVGQEFALTVRPIDGLTLGLTGAHQDATLSAANSDLGAADDERLPNVPRYSASFSADYKLPLELSEVTLGTTVRTVDDRNAGFGATAHELPGYTTVDLRAGLMLGSFDTVLYVRNAFDERGQVANPLGSPPGLAIVSILQPTTVGVRVTKSF